MFRLLGRQAFLDLFVSPPALRVRFIARDRPPSYETIARRFPSDVDPQAYFIRKHQHEAKDHGQSIDIHDISETDPKDYDVLITDIQRETSEGKIAEELGIPYLSKAKKKAIELGDGYIHGLKFKTIYLFI